MTRIVTLTDRIPLALELAAARIKRFTLHQIAAGIEATPLGQMGIASGLRGDDEIALNRHKSLERSLTWSYNLLKDVAQRVLATTSLFADTFDIATLKVVHGVEAEDGINILQEASLVRHADDGEDVESYRFRLHRATREFAALCLTKLTTAISTKRRFVAYYNAFLENGLC